MSGRRAVVLLSGGLDSSTVAACARDDGFVVFPVSLDYGQRHRIELESAARVAEKLQLQPLRIVKIDLRAIGGSALTADVEVPKNRPMDATIPITYVPARNTIFLSVALGYAETLGAFDLYIGANAIDYSGYPDCRPAFLQQFEALAGVATRAGVEGKGKFHVHAPLLKMTKREIVLEAVARRVPLELTHSCYDPGPEGRSCGACDSCVLRARGFLEAGVADPRL